MSQAMFNDGAKDVLGRIAQKRVPEKAERLMMAYGLASEYGVLLPYSRKQESEADHIGVMLMAQAPAGSLTTPPPPIAIAMLMKERRH